MPIQLSSSKSFRWKFFIFYILFVMCILEWIFFTCVHYKLKKLLPKLSYEEKKHEIYNIIEILQIYCQRKY